MYRWRDGCVVVVVVDGLVLEVVIVVVVLQVLDAEWKTGTNCVDHSVSRNEYTVDEVEGRKKKFHEMRRSVTWSSSYKFNFGVNFSSHFVRLLVDFTFIHKYIFLELKIYSPGEHN